MQPPEPMEESVQKETLDINKVIPKIEIQDTEESIQAPNENVLLPVDATKVSLLHLLLIFNS